VSGGLPNYGDVKRVNYGTGYCMATVDLPWKVSTTEKTVSGRTWRHGFGFSIKDFRGLSLLSISYETEREAKQAESAIRRAIAGAIDITRG
jgi:hypothetical protein